MSVGYNEILVLKDRKRREKEATEQNGAGMLAGIGNYKERERLIETITKEYINFIPMLIYIYLKKKKKKKKKKKRREGKNYADRHNKYLNKHCS